MLSWDECGKRDGCANWDDGGMWGVGRVLYVGWMWDGCKTFSRGCDAFGIELSVDVVGYETAKTSRRGGVGWFWVGYVLVAATIKARRMAGTRCVDACCYRLCY